MSTRLYFAYGSNMLLARLRERVPGARAVGVAWFEAHRLCWHKLGQDQSGKCDMVAAQVAGHGVHGVLYEIPISQKPALDRAEGLGHGYEEKLVRVEHQQKHVQAFSYFALQTSPDVLPFTWYQSLVVAGAMEHNLPLPYIETLKAAPAMLDADDARHVMNMRLTGAVAQLSVSDSQEQF